jgi:hypothetical protein
MLGKLALEMCLLGREETLLSQSARLEEHGVEERWYTYEHFPCRRLPNPHLAVQRIVT